MNKHTHQQTPSRSGGAIIGPFSTENPLVLLPTRLIYNPLLFKAKDDALGIIAEKKSCWQSEWEASTTQNCFKERNYIQFNDQAPPLTFGKSNIPPWSRQSLESLSLSHGNAFSVQSAAENIYNTPHIWHQVHLHQCTSVVDESE